LEFVRKVQVGPTGTVDNTIIEAQNGKGAHHPVSEFSALDGLPVESFDKQHLLITDGF
jgi:hypothetical protein